MRVMIVCYDDYVVMLMIYCDGDDGGDCNDDR